MVQKDVNHEGVKPGFFFRKARVTKLLVQILFGDISISEVTQKRLMIFMYQICPVEIDKIMEDSLKNYTT